MHHFCAETRECPFNTDQLFPDMIFALIPSVRNVIRHSNYAEITILNQSVIITLLCATRKQRRPKDLKCFKSIGSAAQRDCHMFLALISPLMLILLLISSVVRSATSLWWHHWQLGRRCHTKPSGQAHLSLLRETVSGVTKINLKVTHCHVLKVSDSFRGRFMGLDLFWEGLLADDETLHRGDAALKQESSKVPHKPHQTSHRYR